MRSAFTSKLSTGLATVAVLATLACLRTEGATHTWDPHGSGGWGSSGRWVGGGTPGAGDTVAFSGCTGIVTAADASYLSGISVVTFSAGAGLVMSNEASEADLSCGAKFSGDGVLIKRGSGVARLTCVETSERQAFYMDGGIEVYAGTLFMPRNITKDCYITRLAVYAPGIFVQAGGNGVSYVSGGLYGDGTISNDVSKTFRVSGGDTNDVPVFSGKFMNKAYFVTWRSGSALGRAQYLTGAEGGNTGNNLLLYTGDCILGVKSFGGIGGSASWGKGGIQWRGSQGYLLYLGEGETSDRTFYFGNGGSMAILDAGEHGGLNLTGAWSVSTTENNQMNALDLTGSGMNVFGGKYSTTTNKYGNPIAHYITKKGDGTWRFTAGKTRETRGVFETQRGELQFESIAERGTMCSLGDATLTHLRYHGDINPENAVSYAYLLGDGSTDVAARDLATMNYVGTDDATVSTRPIAVRGAGRLKSDTAVLDWGGITAVSSGVHTVVLGGESELSRASSVTNGVGTLSVAKDGGGSWTISGDYDFTGGVSVACGTLRLAGTGYEWYRLTIMQTWAGGTNSAGVAFPGDGGNFVVRRWALIDDNGENQVKDIPHNMAADGKPWALAPGEAAMANTNYRFLGQMTGVTYKYALSNLFDTVRDTYTFSAANTKSSSDNYYGLDGDGSNTQAWVRVVVRLPNGALPVTHYDLQGATYIDQTGDSQAIRLPRSWMVEGSTDGISWTVLDAVISNTYEKAVSGGTGHWFSNNSTTMGAGYGPYASGETSRVRPASVASVKANAGATLESCGPLVAKGITYDCTAGGGTVRGFTFAPDATVQLENCDSATIESGFAFFPLDLSGCSGISDTSGWKFTVNGKSMSSRHLNISSSGITLVQVGTMILFR